MSPSNNQARASNASSKDKSSSAGRRQDFKKIRAIPSQRFIELLLLSIQGRIDKSITSEDCTVFARREGGFNHVVCISFVNKGQLERHAIRVPAHGTAEFWRDEDRYMMRREVELLRHLRRHTNVPVPNVIAFSTELDNDSLGAPWMLQEMLPGNIAFNVWFDQPYNESTAYLGADVPSPDTHRKRLNLLKSLANHMAHIGTIDFPLIGIPEIYTAVGMHTVSTGVVTMGPSYHKNDSEDVHEFVKRGPFTSTREYINASFNPLFDTREYGLDWQQEEDPKRHMRIGAGKVLSMIYSTAPFNVKMEQFSIRHTDLDLQNILTDGEGNVTGIIDWDGAFAAPRCIGAAAAPNFLMKDYYFEGNGDFLEEPPHMAWNTAYYRNIYAAAFHKVELELGTGTGTDAQYTSKSALYLQTFVSISGAGEITDFLTKVLCQVPGLSTNKMDLVQLLGRPGGFPRAEQVLEAAIPKIFEPELPAKKFMDELNRACPSAPSPERNSLESSLKNIQVDAPTRKLIKEISMSPRTIKSFVTSLFRKKLSC